MGYSWFEEPKVESVSYTECFEKYCPVYMSYGMSYDDYWNDDCYKARYYLRAHKEILRQKDMELWEQGMYIYEAICDVAPILHPFSKAKKPLPYRDKPYLIESKTKTKEEVKQEVDNERLKAQIWLNNWVRSTKKQFKKQ